MKERTVEPRHENIFQRIADLVAEYSGLVTMTGLLILCIVPYFQYVGYRYKRGKQYFEEGLVSQQNGEFLKAELAYQRALGSYRGWLIPDSEEAVDVPQKLGEVYYTQGQIYADEADFKNANEAFQKAFEFDPANGKYKEAANANPISVQISGSVRDSKGSPIPGAKISVQSGKSETIVDGSGGFKIAIVALPTGHVPVSISARVHKPYAESIRIEPGKPTYELHVILEGPPMMRIPSGEFKMGSATYSEDERPVHDVYLDAFYIDVYEVTNAQFEAFMTDTGHAAPQFWTSAQFNAPDQPVVGVSWHDAAAYCQWAGKRLPTEAEWEKAARGGLVGKVYPWGDKKSHDYANYSGTGGQDQWEDRPSPVGSFPANAFGLYDMASNVWEWCMDEWDKYFYANSPRRNPVSGNFIEFVDDDFLSIKTRRVLRGGSWYYGWQGLRVSNRYLGDPAYSSNRVGFRCARTATP